MPVPYPALSGEWVFHEIPERWVRVRVATLAWLRVDSEDSTLAYLAAEGTHVWIALPCSLLDT
jgi:hypothetical protein